MRRCYLALVLLLFTIQAAFAQIQQGYVRTLGRPEKKGEALGNVIVRAKGEHNFVNSNDDGTFSMPLPGKKNGEAYSLQQVQKTGYELNEADFIGRQFAFSDKVPLVIVMVSTLQLQADKQRIEDNAYKTAEKNFKIKIELLEKQRDNNRITIEQYQERIQDLQGKFEKYQSLIESLSEHYAHTDYDLLNEKDREINICIEDGELERADSLIHLLFDPVGVLERNKEALVHIEQQIDEANKIIFKANEDMAAVLRQQVKDAEYLYQLYTIALARFDNEKALFYIQTRAELDTVNPSWQFDAGYCFQEHNDYAQAKKYYLRALERYRNLAKDNPKAYEPELASTLNNLAVLYKNTQQNEESETLYLEALESYKRLAKDRPKHKLDYKPSFNQKNKPKDYEFEEARTLNNLALLYSNTQRFAESETMYLEALEIRRRLAKYDPETHEPGLAMTLNNLAILYKKTQRLSESEVLQLEALEIQRRLAKNDPQTFESDLAMTINNLAVLYSNTQRLEESKALHLEVLEIYKHLAKDNPQNYEPVLAMTLNNLALLYKNTQHLAESEPFFLEALEIYKRLEEDSLRTYEPDMAMALNELADLNFNRQRFAESETMYLQALDIYRRLEKDTPQTYDSYLVTTISSLAIIYYKTHRFMESESMYLDALDIYRRLAKSNPQVFEPRLANSLYSLGLLYWQQDQHLQAIPIFEEALVLYRSLVLDNPSNRKWYENTLDLLAQLYQRTGEHTKCHGVNEERIPLLKKHYQNDITYRKDCARALGDQSLQCLFVGQFEKSEQYALETLSIDSTQILVNVNLAAALLLQGKYTEAETVFFQYKDELKDSFLQNLIDIEFAGIIPEERKEDVERIRELFSE